MLKLRCHYASLDKFYNLNIWIVQASLYSKIRAIFAMRPVYLYGEKFVFSVTARYIVHMLKLQGHYASFDKLYNLNVWIVPASLYSKVRAIFAIWPVHLYGEKFVFSVTAQYVVHMLKLQCHYVSFDKFNNLNVWIVPASLYLKVRTIFALPCSTVCFYEISRFLRIFDNPIIEDYKLLYTTSYSSDHYSLENSVQPCLLR